MTKSKTAYVAVIGKPFLEFPNVFGNLRLIVVEEKEQIQGLEIIGVIAGPRADKALAKFALSRIRQEIK